MRKPTYQELVLAFWEYLSCSNNGGEGVAPNEDDIERAYAILDTTGVANPYD